LQNHDDIDQELCGSSDETWSLENNKESQELGGIAHDWSQVNNQVRNEEQKFNKWLINSGTSVHVMNEKQDLLEPKPMTQAVMIGSRKAMVADAVGIKPTRL